MEALAPLTPDRRREQTREHLLTAAAQVFADRGFHGATIDQIAQAAGFTKGAVYHHFISKDDLFLALIERQLTQAMDRLRATLESSDVPPEARLADFVELLRGPIANGPPGWVALNQEFRVYASRHEPARRKLIELDEIAAHTIAEMIEAGRARMGIDLPEPPLQVARVILTIDHGIAAVRAVDPTAIDDAFLETFMTMLARGLGVPSDPR